MRPHLKIALNLIQKLIAVDSANVSLDFRIKEVDARRGAKIEDILTSKADNANNVHQILILINNYSNADHVGNTVVSAKIASNVKLALVDFLAILCEMIVYVYKSVEMVKKLFYSVMMVTKKMEMDARVLVRLKLDTNVWVVHHLAKIDAPKRILF